MGGVGANPYPGWWATSNKKVVFGEPPPEEELPEWYQEPQWNYQYFEKEENWYSDSSNFHDNPFQDHGSFNFSEDKEYKVLGLKRSSSQEEIKQAFRKKAMETHPDKGGDPAEFRKVREAYECLIS